jgi:hypothetical protein
MGSNPKPPIPPAQIGAAIGVPAGKKLSLRNLVRAKKGMRRPKAAADPGDHEYR